MSNLGAYQWITTMSKKVGGPEKLIALIAVGSISIYKGSEIAVKKLIKAIKKSKAKAEEKGPAYKVLIPAESNEGLKFNIGDEFYVLETDGNVLLIEKIGDLNNPYFVDIKLLNEISNYEGGEK